MSDEIQVKYSRISSTKFDEIQLKYPKIQGTKHKEIKIKIFKQSRS